MMMTRSRRILFKKIKFDENSKIFLERSVLCFSRANIEKSSSHEEVSQSSGSSRVWLGCHHLVGVLCVQETPSNLYWIIDCITLTIFTRQSPSQARLSLSCWRKAMIDCPIALLEIHFCAAKTGR